MAITVNANLDLWVRQLQGIGNASKLRETAIRSLMKSRIKGGAQTWLYSKRTFLVGSIDSLINEVKCRRAPQQNKIGSQVTSWRRFLKILQRQSSFK